MRRSVHPFNDSRLFSRPKPGLGRCQGVGGGGPFCGKVIGYSGDYC